MSGWRSMIALAAGAAMLIGAGVPLADVARQRVAGYREIGAAYKGVNDQLRSGRPDSFMLRTYADQLADLSRQQSRWYAKGSDSSTGVKTRALPAAWSNGTELARRQAAFSAAAARFAATVRSGDRAAMTMQARMLGQTCAACHKTFRAED